MKYNKKEICPYLEFGASKNNTKVEVFQVVKAILSRLKTGCQWHQLPMKQFCRCKYLWQSVYYHFHKWSKDGSCKNVWQSVLSKHKKLLYLSGIQLDCTHTLTKRGGEAVAYQGRKKTKTNNILILTDSQGIPLTCSNSIAGNHSDFFSLVSQAKKMVTDLEAVNIRTDGLFLDIYSCFYPEDFRRYLSEIEVADDIDQNWRNGKINNYLFGELLYKHRFVIERKNAWMDAFKAISVRFETNSLHWKALSLLAFTVILLRKR